MPTAAYIGMSRRIDDESERSRLHAIAGKICPKGMGLIIRTVTMGMSEEALTKMSSISRETLAIHSGPVQA